MMIQYYRKQVPAYLRNILLGICPRESKLT